METEKQRREHMAQNGLGPEALDDYEACLNQKDVVQNLGKRLTAESVTFDLDTEYENHCVPNGD